MKLTPVTILNCSPVMTTDCPALPLVGVNDVIVVPCSTVKSRSLNVHPLELNTLILPDVASAGRYATMEVSPITVCRPPIPVKATLYTPVKFNPVIVTSVPACPLVGVNEMIVGSTPKSASLVAVPLLVVTVIFPVAEPFGTVAEIEVELFTVKLAVRPLNFTAVVPVKVVPVMVTVSPTLATAGVKLLMIGNTLKLATLVADPLGVVTDILPVSAPIGTSALIVL